METIDLIAGLGWDPEIRGFLAVLTGVVVLMGSVWLLLATNAGTRLGTLIAGAGFFGWMAIMASVWWIYGIGYSGDRPTFLELEIVDENQENGAHLDFAENDVAETLLSGDLPSAQDILIAQAATFSDEYANFIQESDGAFTIDTDGMANSGVQEMVDFAVAWLEFGVLTEELLTEDQIVGLSAEEIDTLLDEENAKNGSTTLSELAAVAPDLIPDNLEALGDWRLLSTAEMGEAQASAIAALIDSGDYNFASATEFKILNGYASGGKDGLPEDPSRWDRISTQITSALTIKHPTGYAIIQMQAVTERSIDNLPGDAPQRPLEDLDEPIISVIMIRDLGNLRQLPALVTIGSLLIFLAFCYMLHERDKVVMARRAEFAAES
jgi:hypothetical protein